MSGSATDRAYEAIRRAILDGTHQPETMLSEGELATSIGVSRTPVRAALARLSDEGWITVYPKRGALVRGMDERAIADLAGARLMLETSGTRQSSTGQRAALATRLQPELARQDAALARGDTEAFIELTVAFHGAFVALSGNAVIVELGDRLADRQRFLLRQHREILVGRRAEIHAEHARLLELLGADDVAGFAEALRAHLSDTHGPELGPEIADKAIM